jgi:hypothetical protein
LPPPRGLLPVLLGDYLVAHFALYGALTALGLVVLGRRGTPTGLGGGVVRPWWVLASAVVLACAWSVLALGLPVDRYADAVLPTSAERLAMVLAMLLGTVPLVMADEWLTRRAGAPRGAYAVTKLCLLLSLAIAILLDPRRLFFLAIAAPAILAFYLVHGLFGAWTWRATGHPVVSGLATALALACAVATTFPLIALAG